MATRNPVAKAPRRAPVRGGMGRPMAPKPRPGQPRTYRR